jgi:hypothetical protein
MTNQKNRKQKPSQPKPPQMQAAPAKKSSPVPYIIGAVVLVGIIAWAILRNAADLPAGTQKFADQGQSLHLDSLADPVRTPYNSNPPTSGWHVGSMVSPWGIQAEPVDDRVSVHNIEHGGIIIHYKPSLEANALTELKAIAGDFQRQNPCVLMVPRAEDQMDAPIVMTAWNYLLPLQTVDKDSMTLFFADRVGKGPEKNCTPLR